MKNRHLLTVAAALCASTLGLAACGGGSGETAADGPVSLDYTWWGSQDRADRMTKAIAAFEASHPDIDINPNFSDFEGYWQKRATEAAGGGLPDVMQFDLSYLRQYAERGALLDIAELGDAVDTSTIEETLLPSGQIDGATYGVPISTNALGHFYNPAILEQAGVAAPTGDMTWDEYDAWIREVTEKSPEGVFGSGDYTSTFWLFDMYLRQQGKQAVTEDGEIGFTKAELKEWWESPADLRQDGSLISAERTTQLDPKSPFGANETASEFSWDNFLAGYLTDTGAEKLEIVAPPTDTGDRGLFLKASMLYAIGANTENPEAAAEFVDFMVNDPEVGAIFGTSRGIPASETQREGATFEGADAQIVAYEESIADELGESPAPLPIGFGTLESNFKRLASDVNYGRYTVDEAVDQWFAEAESALQQ
ncbi:extracellular solute-binding protein [Paenibacillus sp. TRM 82003]|uniref:ABC transporter substrate-binding protein n=1 Tax=Kineococcus sp. TRM81007 TaxID=2925831 RepID=UPI001F5787C1|nr:extracellular solute-binding protein [Kineococcus sp. TRM81007]MCI2238149.1 extracellular solute-binding protein [Kineococcus sp. TRM81007]MCI3920533.1 extracellular solute-binding protein [Paenibacillus sp. TRM 82003]